MKGLRTIRFDISDTHVFEKAAEPGEWAVSGGFAFADAAPSMLKGKARQAFANGFLGLSTLGRSTFVTVSEMSAIEFDEAASALADHFVDCYGAPSGHAALPQAVSELEFACGLCVDVPINTIFALRRQFDDAGALREEFRIVEPPSQPLHSRIWDVTEDE